MEIKHLTSRSLGAESLRQTAPEVRETSKKCHAHLDGAQPAPTQTLPRFLTLGSWHGVRTMPSSGVQEARETNGGEAGLASVPQNNAATVFCPSFSGRITSSPTTITGIGAGRATLILPAFSSAVGKPSSSTSPC